MRIFPFFLLLLCIACEQPLRPPYIQPTLQHWPKPYKGVAKVKLHVFKTGEITVPKKVVYRAGSLLETFSLDVLVFAVEHPRQGIVLIGSGLSRGVMSEAESYLGAFRTAMGSLTMEEGQDILSQLESANLSVENVHNIILPDLRFSHTGELENFPHARAIVSSAEYAVAMEEGESALSISDEYDGVQQWQFIDFAGSQPLGTFVAHQDLFGDGSILLLDVAGATPGGLAVIVRLPQTPVFLSGNLAWTEEQARYAREPGFVFHRQSWWDNAWRLKKFAELAPELVILPDHDWDAIHAARTKDMILHPFPPEEATASNGEKEQKGKTAKGKEQEKIKQKRSG